MSTGTRTLRRINLFENLSDGRIADIEAACDWREYGPHQQIIDRQSDSRDVFFVVDGSVRVVNYSLSGREVSFEDIPEGGYFGELAAIDGEPRSATVVALNKTTVATLRPEPFMKMVLADAELAQSLFCRLAHVVRQSTERIFDLSVLGAHNRVYAELLRLTGDNVDEETDTGEIKPIPIHADIASRVSTTRETVARVLSELTKAGLVTREKNRLIITDVERLRDMVHDFKGF